MKNIKKFALLAFVMLTGMNGLEAKKAGKITNRSSHTIDVTFYDNMGLPSVYNNVMNTSVSNPISVATVEAIVTPIGHEGAAPTPSSIRLAKTPIGYDGSYLIKDSADGQSLILTFTNGTTIVPPLS